MARLAPPLLLAVLLATASGCSPRESPSPTPVEDTPRPLIETTYFWADQDWRPSSRQVYTYASSDTEAEAITEQAWSDSVWVDQAQQRWELDAQGRQVTGIVSEQVEDAMMPRMQMRFYYADGLKIAAVRRVRDGDGWMPSDSLASEFDDGDEVRRLFYGWADGAWSLSLVQTSAYDEAGLERERLHAAPSADSLEYQRRWTFAYEAERMKESLVENWNSGAWAPWLRQRYEHDARGAVEAIVHDEWSHDKWTPWMRNETVYETE